MSDGFFYFDDQGFRTVVIWVIGEEQRIVIECSKGGWAEIHDGYVAYTQHLTNDAVKVLPMHQVEKLIARKA